MKRVEREAMEKMEKLQEMIEASPLTQQIIADKAAETLIKRKSAADRIEALKLEAETHATLQTEIDNSLAELASLDKTRQELKIDINKKYISLSQKRHAIEAGISHEEQILYDSYDPRIDETISFFRDKLDYLRKPGRITKTGGKSIINLFSWTRTMKGESNVKAIHDSIAYCQNAIKELEKMKLLPELDTLKLQAIKDGIPSTDVYEEITGQKPMEKQNPSWDVLTKHVDEKIAKLFQKVGISRT